MIDIGGIAHFVVVVACAALAMMAFVAALQGFFFDRNRRWETAALLVICFTLFRPNFWMDFFVPPLATLPASEVMRVAGEARGGALRLRVGTEDIEGDPVTKAVRLTLSDKGEARDKLAQAGLTLSSLGGQLTIASVRPGSEAARLKLRPGDRVEGVSVPANRPSPFIFAFPALVVLAAIALMQRRRRRRTASATRQNAKEQHPAHTLLQP